MSNSASDTTEEPRWLCPVQGVEADTDIGSHELFALGDETVSYSFRLITITDEDRSQLEQRLEHLPMSSLELHLTRLAIETNTPAVFGEEPVRSMGLRYSTFALALIHGRGDVPACYLTNDRNGGFPQAGFDGVRGGATNAVPLQLEKLEAVRAYAHRAANLGLRFMTPMTRYRLACARPQYLDSLIDLVIAMESVLGTDKAKTFADLTGKVMAKVWGRSEQATASTARAIYELRSLVVHGRHEQAVRHLETHFEKRVAIAAATGHDLATGLLTAALLHPKILEKKGRQAFLDELVL